MSGKNLELSLVMRLRDLASSGFTRSQRDIQSSITKTEKATNNLTRTVGNLGKVRSAAEVLGIRTEQNIQREIQRTEAAYNRLKASGSMSMREQARAADTTRNKIRELNNEMGKFTLGQKAMRGLQTGASVVGGVAAAGYVLGKPIGQTMDYGMRLAHMSNTAFHERDTLGRAAGKRELNSDVVSAARYGGGTRDSVEETLSMLIASGTFSASDAGKKILPSLAMSASANDASPLALGQIAIAGIESFGLSKDSIQGNIDQAARGGQLGRFELKDMAPWLPRQMASANSLLGMKGNKDFATLIALNQASRTTAGTADEAGNNVDNLLRKINSNDTAQDFKKLGYNLSGSLADAKSKGVNPVQAFVDFTEKIAMQDKGYVALKKKADDARNPEEKRAVYGSMAQILEGSAIGKVVQDAQALKALVGAMNQRDKMAEIERDASFDNASGTSKNNFSSVSAEAGFKTQQAANEKIFATQTAFENLTPLIGSVADGFTAIAQEYPNLTVATVAATTALAALAAAAGAAGLIQMLGGGGKDGGILKSILTKTKGAPGALVRAATAALPGITALGTGTLAASTAMVAGAGAAGYGVGTGLNAAGGYLAKGTMMEGFATDVIGKMVAQIMATLVRSKDAEEALVINLHLDGQQITQVVNARNNNTARRN